LAGLDSLTNIEEKWSVDDLYDAHEALDVKAEMEHFMMENARNGQR
jgi:hypothetical protein